MERIKITFTYDVDTDTGEIVLVNKEIDKSDIKAKSTSSNTKKKKVEDNDPTPRLVLEDNKFILNNAAIELLGVAPESRIDIKYEKEGQYYIPVIGTDIAFKTIGKGNKLTKSNSVSLRGKKREELEPFGTNFTIEPHPDKEGLFILKGETEVLANNVIDENIEINSDVDLSDLVKDDQDDITAFNFTL